MSRYLSYILILITVAITGCKKETLHWQKVVLLETHTQSRLNRITFLDKDNCIVAGGEKFEKAEILLSADRGNTWHLQSFPEAGKGMYGLVISPSRKIYASGFDGKIIHTNNINASWQVSQIADWRFYLGIAYPSDDTGIYISTEAQARGTIVRVDKHFKILDTTGFAFGLNDIEFASPAVGYIAAFSTILKTEDGGNTWKILDVKNDNFMAVWCIDENEVWACGYNGSIVHTTDGGNTWTQARNGNKVTQSRYRLTDILFKDKQNGWVVGEEGLIIKTTDGGNTWQPYKSFTDATLLNIAISEEGNIFVCGEKGTLCKLYQ